MAPGATLLAARVWALEETFLLLTGFTETLHPASEVAA